MKWGEGITITVKRVHIQGIPEEWCGRQMWEIQLTSGITSAWHEKWF